MVMVMMMSILGFLAGCGGKKTDVFARNVPFPPETQLVGLYMTHQGMATEPYYILNTTDTGIWMKITNQSPEISQMDSGTDIRLLEENWQYFGFANTVLDCENASIVLLENTSSVRELEDAIVQSGALGWDGYEEHRSKKGVEDAGDTYVLFLKLSDGTTVKVHGYNACPEGFNELLGCVMKIFYKNIKN